MKRKLTSRKFWTAVAGFITPLLLTFGVSAETTSKIVGLILAGASLIVYTISESVLDVDSILVNGTTDVEPEKKEEG